MNKYHLIIIFFMFLSSLSQVFLKLAANENKKGLSYFLNFKVILSYGILFAISFLNASYVYKGLQMSTISSFESLAYIFVPILSYFFLKEKIKPRTFIGITLIIIGLLIFNM